MRRGICYLDIDGVLADFEGSTLELCGIPRGDTHLLTHWDAFDGLPNSSQWRDKIRDSGRPFWEDLPKLPWADEVFGLCKSAFSKVILMTHPGIWVEAAPGKTAWISREFPSADGFCLTDVKGFLAGPGKTLIDDNRLWCDQFSENGGEVFCFPRPWNGRNVPNPESHLREFLDQKSRLDSNETS